MEEEDEGFGVGPMGGDEGGRTCHGTSMVLRTKLQFPLSSRSTMLLASTKEIQECLVQRVENMGF